MQNKENYGKENLSLFEIRHDKETMLKDCTAPGGRSHVGTTILHTHTHINNENKHVSHTKENKATD